MTTVTPPRAAQARLTAGCSRTESHRRQVSFHERHIGIFPDIGFRHFDGVQIDTQDASGVWRHEFDVLSPAAAAIHDVLVSTRLERVRPDPFFKQEQGIIVKDLPLLSPVALLWLR
jgi:hypothetical protein